FMLLVITGAGDELQGMKKGVMELADAIVVNKADGNNVMKAEATRVEYDRILHYLRPATEGWVTHAHTCSAVSHAGIPELWGVVGRFMETVRASGVFAERRRRQVLSWVQSMVEDHLLRDFYECAAVKEHRAEIEERVVRGELAATQATLELLRWYGRRT
ncbi:MAG: methylmalonyl Co-A mutase-associated GTPase MeaB, partial [Fretibacterium sp.]